MVVNGEHLDLEKGGATPMGIQPKERGGLETTETYVDYAVERDRQIQATTRNLVQQAIREARQYNGDMEVDPMLQALVDAPALAYESDESEMGDQDMESYEATQVALQEQRTAVNMAMANAQRDRDEQRVNPINLAPVQQMIAEQKKVGPSNNLPIKQDKFDVPAKFDFKPTLVKNNSDPMNITNYTSSVSARGAHQRDRDATAHTRRYFGDSGVELKSIVALTPDKEMDVDKVISPHYPDPFALDKQKKNSLARRRRNKQLKEMVDEKKTAKELKKGRMRDALQKKVVGQIKQEEGIKGQVDPEIKQETKFDPVMMQALKEAQAFGKIKQNSSKFGTVNPLEPGAKKLKVSETVGKRQKNPEARKLANDARDQYRVIKNKEKAGTLTAKDFMDLQKIRTKSKKSTVSEKNIEKMTKVLANKHVLLQKSKSNSTRKVRISKKRISK